jgi:uncharacterized protein YodC (DUF2158 family)
MSLENESSNLQSGDVVRLKSGGSSMTAERVVDTVEQPYARCAWEDRRGVVQIRYFTLAALQLASPDDNK